MLLEAKNLDVCYGAVRALSDASFQVNEGEVVAMIGQNGAGKSTAIKAVAGLLDYYNGQLIAGTVTYAGKDITGCSADQLARMGIAVVPEGRRIFGSMSVAENLEMGGYLLTGKADVAQSIESVLKLFDPLKKLFKRTAGTLSGGEQQMLAIGRSLILQPKLLIADEISLGLSPNYVEIIQEKLRDIHAAGTSILLVEQNVDLALAISNRTYVFETGRISSSALSMSLRDKIDMKSMFLGKS